jgi:guanine deaminase
MREAIRLSCSKMQENRAGPFGVVVVHEEKIIARGWNQVTSRNDPPAHVEIVAIRIATRKLKTFRPDGCELYTSCEPCPMCLAAIYWARIKFDDGSNSREMVRPLANRKIPTQQLMRGEAIKAFQAWEAKPDKLRY